eukprot:361504-Pelagomonas_calceolata.AAC.2
MQRMKAGPERDRVVYEAKLKQREQEAAAAVRDAIAKSEEGRNCLVKDLSFTACEEMVLSASGGDYYGYTFSEEYTW